MTNERYIPRGEYVTQPLEKRLIRLSKSEEERAQELHEKHVSIDLQTLTIDPFSGFELQVDDYPLEKVHNSGLTCLFETVETGLNNPFMDPGDTIRLVRQYAEFFESKTDISIARNADDIKKAKVEGR